MTGTEGKEIDLFGPVSAASADMSTVLAGCVTCGQTFEAPRPLGRPRLFCSDPCRRAGKLKRVREFVQRPSEPEPTHCAGCGRPLPQRDVNGSRYRRFCTPLCRKSSLRAAGRGPDLLNLINEKDEP